MIMPGIILSIISDFINTSVIASIIDIFMSIMRYFLAKKKTKKNNISFYCTVILNKSLNQHFQQWPLQNHMSGQVILSCVQDVVVIEVILGPCL